jgi:chromosome partitioning protein
VGATVDLCERAGKPLIFVVNAATPKAKITSEAAVALSQHGTVAPDHAASPHRFCGVDD